MSPLHRSQLLKGTTELLILSVLEDEPRHGYEIAQLIHARAAGLALSDGALYPALHRLEKRGALDGWWQPGSGGPRRRYYTLTDEGRGLLADARQEWDRFVSEVGSVAGAAHVALAEARRV
jgi:DNA-binding PadR family transcriptional regulator